MKIKDVDKTLVASVALHVLVLGWAMVSVSTKALEMPPEDSVPVDVISSDQLAKVMAGMKTGKRRSVSREMRHAGRLTEFVSCAGWVPICGSPYLPGAAPGYLVPYFQANYASYS